MTKPVLSAWMIGWAITLISSALMAVVHTPLALIGTVLLLPGMLGMPLVFKIGRMLALSDNTLGIMSLISTGFFASFFYGAIVFIVLRLRKRKSKSTLEPDTSSV